MELAYEDLTLIFSFSLEEVLSKCHLRGGQHEELCIGVSLGEVHGNRVIFIFLLVYSGVEQPGDDQSFSRVTR